MQVIEGTGCVPLCRLPVNDPVHFKWALDAGARGASYRWSSLPRMCVVPWPAPGLPHALARTSCAAVDEVEVPLHKAGLTRTGDVRGDVPATGENREIGGCL